MNKRVYYLDNLSGLLICYMMLNHVLLMGQVDCSVDNIESCDEEEEPVVVKKEKSNESFRGMSRKQRNKYQKRRKNNRYDY